jgi:hypothetical protein
LFSLSTALRSSYSWILSGVIRYESPGHLTKDSSKVGICHHGNRRPGRDLVTHMGPFREYFRNTPCIKG